VTKSLKESSCRPKGLEASSRRATVPSSLSNSTHITMSQAAVVNCCPVE